jgi:hypothetical protein
MAITMGAGRITAVAGSAANRFRPHIQAEFALKAMTRNGRNWFRIDSPQHFQKAMTARFLTPLQKVERKTPCKFSEMGSASPTDIPNAGALNHVCIGANGASRFVDRRGVSLPWCVHRCTPWRILCRN